MTVSYDTSLNQYAQHLFDILQLLRIYKSQKVFSILTRWTSGIMIIICLFANLALLLSELIGLKDTNDLNQIARQIGVASFHVTGIVKWCYCMWKIDTITNLIDMLQSCHNYSKKICQNTQDRENLHKELEVSRKWTSRFAYYWPPIGIVTAMHYCFNPMSFRLYKIYVQKHESDDVSKILPFDGWFPWDKDKYYGYSYFLQMCGLIGCCMGSICYDQLYVSTLLIVSSQLKFLGVALRSKQASYVEELGNVGSPCMFVQCVQNIIVLCLASFEAATFQIIPEMESIVKLINLLEFAVGVTVQLLFFCFVATEITTRGLEVANAVYASEWVSSFNYLQLENINSRENHKIKYSVLMISVRSQRPILLTGGPFYILSLETFKSIVGIAVSNALVLSQVFEE